MRFVSKYPRLGLGTVVKEKFVLALDGQRDRTQDALAVQFTQESLTDSDLAFALSHWREKEFTGRWLDADHVTLQPLGERIGVYDTREEQDRNGWSDEMREMVEKWMLRKNNYGSDFTQVTVIKPLVMAPWANYDTTHWKQIPILAEQLGLVREALAYETANKNRESITGPLTDRAAELGDPEAADGELVAA